MIGTSREIKVGPYTIRIVKQGTGFAGIVVGKAQDRVEGATSLEVETKLRARIAEIHPDFIGLDGAVSRFKSLFKDGFKDPAYLGDDVHGERVFKLNASELLRRELPLAEVSSIPDAGKIALRVVQKTILIDQFSKTRLSAVLRGPRAIEFLMIAKAFAEGDTSMACKSLVAGFKEEGIASWVCLTYLPFLWRPDRHMFLKPEFTKAFAERIGHRFQHDYVSQPNPDTYASLLKMAADVRAAVSTMNPEDNIDIHSFMWAVMDYRDEDVVAPSTDS